jgi:hypothetical protein
MRDYELAIRARARDGIASHGTLAAFINDFRESRKFFRMVVAYRMSLEHGRAFWCWEDVPPEVKDALGLPHGHSGIDVTDGTTTIVQCKLSTKTLTFRDVSTLIACSLKWTDGAMHVPWSSVLVVRNACSKTSIDYKLYDARIGFDAPLQLADVESLVSGLLQVDADVGLDVARALRESGGGYVSVRLVESAADAGSGESESDSEASADGADSAAEMLYTAVYDAMGVAVDVHRPFRE